MLTSFVILVKHEYKYDWLHDIFATISKLGRETFFFWNATFIVCCCQNGWMEEAFTRRWVGTRHKQLQNQQ